MRGFVDLTRANVFLDSECAGQLIAYLTPAVQLVDRHDADSFDTDGLWKTASWCIQEQQQLCDCKWKKCTVCTAKISHSDIVSFYTKTGA